MAVGDSDRLGGGTIDKCVGGVMVYCLVILTALRHYLWVILIHKTK